MPVISVTSPYLSLSSCCSSSVSFSKNLFVKSVTGVVSCLSTFVFAMSSRFLEIISDLKPCTSSVFVPG